MSFFPLCFAPKYVHHSSEPIIIANKAIKKPNTNMSDAILASKMSDPTFLDKNLALGVWIKEKTLPFST
jgi:hypothetical protein